MSDNTEKKVDTAIDTSGATAGSDTTKGDEAIPALNEQERKATQGSSGPNPIPAFMRRVAQDENTEVTSEEEFATTKVGSEAQSPGTPEDRAKGIDMPAMLAAASVGAEAPDTKEESVQYTSRIARLRIGRFQFEGGVLTVPANRTTRLENGEEVDNFDSAEDFEALVRQVHPRTQAAIRKIERGEGVIAKPLNLEGRSVRGVDTTARGPQSPKPSDSQ